jgi:hypothetical protein
VAAIAVAPVLTLSLVSPSAPLEVTGTASPALGTVIVDLYRVAGGHRHLVAAKRVAAGGGQFTARFRPGRPGRYVAVARTPASDRFAAASSAPLPVTIPG